MNFKNRLNFALIIQYVEEPIDARLYLARPLGFLPLLRPVGQIHLFRRAAIQA
jgi:hypothetical protein